MECFAGHCPYRVVSEIIIIYVISGCIFSPLLQNTLRIYLYQSYFILSHERDIAGYPLHCGHPVHAPRKTSQQHYVIIYWMQVEKEHYILPVHDPEI